ncbi:MAG: N-acetyltransferase [Candidatus Xenobia bacterium]
MKPWSRKLHDLPRSNGRCTWIDLDHAGRVAFIKALQAATSENAWQRASWETARQLFDTLQQRHYDPDWWRLGYLEQKVPTTTSPQVEPCAVVVPQREGAAGTLGFFGVVPQWRGEGLGREAVVEGLRVLAEGGLHEVVMHIEGELAIRILRECGFEDRGSPE